MGIKKRVRTADADNHQTIDQANPLHTGSLVMISDPATAAIEVSITGMNRFFAPSITAYSSHFPSSIN